MLMPLSLILHNTLSTTKKRIKKKSYIRIGLIIAPFPDSPDLEFLSSLNTCLIRIYISFRHTKLPMLKYH